MRFKGGKELLELQSLKEKASMKYWLIGIVYLLVLASFLLVLYPQLQEAGNLRQAIADELEQHKLLTVVINQRSNLVKSIKEYEEQVSNFEHIIPRSFDLPTILLSIRQLADLADLELNQLEYSPMETSSSSNWYPISLEVTGEYIAIYRFIQALNTFLPSAKFSAVQLLSVGQQQVLLKSKFNLYTIPASFEIENRWVTPTWSLTDELVNNGFGVPLVVLEEFYNGGLRLLGTIGQSDGSNSRALVSFHGEQSWKKVGSYVGIGRIISIQPQSIIVDVNGFEITIIMGG